MICAIVPARGASKGLSRKNLRLLAGRPLIAYAIEAGLNAASIDRVIVSTEDAEIAGVARSLGADVPFVRPAELAGDDTPTLPVVQHAVAWLEAGGVSIEAVVLLQPTSPMRRASHIDAAVRIFRETGAGSVVSVCDVDHSPYLMYFAEGEGLRPVLPEAARNRARRQDLPLVRRLNGAVYVTRRDVLMDQGRIVDDAPRALVMSREDSVDIDDELDLRWAEFLNGSRARS